MTWFTPFDRYRFKLQHFHEEQLSKTRRSGHAHIPYCRCLRWPSIIA